MRPERRRLILPRRSSGRYGRGSADCGAEPLGDFRASGLTSAWPDDIVQVDANTRGRSVPALRKRLLRYRPVSITEGPDARTSCTRSSGLAPLGQAARVLASLRAAPHHRRSKDLGRTRSPGPQADQAHRPGRLTPPADTRADSRRFPANHPYTTPTTISGRSN